LDLAWGFTKVECHPEYGITFTENSSEEKAAHSTAGRVSEGHAIRAQAASG
jgi:hypothetical protein